jgi:hypothetical protein
MTRFTWMQFRSQALVALSGLGIVAIALALTGPHLVHLYDTTVATCTTQRDCSLATSALITDGNKVSIVLRVVMEVVPALIGIFWGAPLVARELETGTYRLAWTQVTRTHWTSVKLFLLALVSMAVAGALSLMATWWASPLDRVRLTPFTSFDQRGVVVVGYAAFAFVLGVTAGVVTRRTLPAMAGTLAVFVGARLAVAHWARPHLAALSHVVVRDTVIATGSSTGTADPRDWIISDQTINAQRQVIGQFGSIGPNGSTTVFVGAHGIVIKGAGSCPGLHSQTTQNVQDCVDQLRIREMLSYQPINHYWTLQWLEMGIFLGAAVILSGFCLWWVRHRLS